MPLGVISPDTPWLLLDSVRISMKGDKESNLRTKRENNVRDALRDMSVPIQELRLMIWKDCQGLGRNKIKKLVTRRSRKEMRDSHF